MKNVIAIFASTDGSRDESLAWMFSEQFLNIAKSVT